MYIPLPTAGFLFAGWGVPSLPKESDWHPSIDEVLDPVSLVKQVESNIGRFDLKGNER